MIKNSVKFLIVAFIMAITFCMPNKVIASKSSNINWQTWVAKDNVPNNKVWKLRFHSPLDVSTIIEKNIYVTDENGNILSMFYTQNLGDDMSIYVSPVKKYEAGSTYTLWIKDLKSKRGKHLAKNIKMEFTIKNDGEKRKTVEVRSAKELLENIESDITIILKKGEYNLLNPEVEDNYSISYEDVFDGRQLVISDVNNLTIKGEDKELTKLLVSPRYANVISFRNCNNINISNITSGHYKEKGNCTGGVFVFQDSKDININNSVLFGCGTEGVNLSNVENFNFNDSVIKECSYGIMTLNNSSNVRFSDSKFHDNKEFDLININNSENVKFDDCNIYRNETNSEIGYSLFNVDEYSNVEVKNSDIKNNNVQYLINSGNDEQDNVVFYNVNYKGNSFVYYK